MGAEDVKLLWILWVGYDQFCYTFPTSKEVFATVASTKGGTEVLGKG